MRCLHVTQEVRSPPLLTSGQSLTLRRASRPCSFQRKSRISEICLRTAGRQKKNQSQKILIKDGVFSHPAELQFLVEQQEEENRNQARDVTFTPKQVRGRCAC